MDESSTQERPSNGEDEISLLDLAGTLLKHKKLILISTICIAGMVLLYALGSLLLPSNVSYLPNVYKPKATMLVNSNDSSGLSSMLASSGLSSLAGHGGRLQRLKLWRAFGLHREEQHGSRCPYR